MGTVLEDTTGNLYTQIGVFDHVKIVIPPNKLPRAKPAAVRQKAPAPEGKVLSECRMEIVRAGTREAQRY